MRPHLREFLELCAKTLDCPEPIVEIGAFQVAGQERIADLRPLFPGKRYLGCDMQPGQGVDRLEDIHNLSFRRREVGTFILADTLEHVWDPIRAMREIYRCLRDDGVVIYTSVMHFPIHSYPNDYWRFTPETFRALAADFSSIAIFYNGSRGFPHTVCGVAGKAHYDVERIRKLANQLSEIRTPAPFIAEPGAAAIIQHLTQKIVGQEGSQLDVLPGTEKHAGFDHLMTPGWFLLTGQWIQGWAAMENASRIQIMLGDRVIHRTVLSQPRPDIAQKLGLKKIDAPIGFRDQIDLTGIGDLGGVLQMVVSGSDNQDRVVCSSAPGLLLGSISFPTAFMMHSFDETNRKRDDAAALLESLRSRNEPINVDLGCGFRKIGNVGIDCRLEGTSADIVCMLGFEPIPLDDAVADTVFCKHFIEHVPKAYYSEREGKLRYPVIELMNEVWRILKPGGTFTLRTPCYPAPEVHQDPTHLSVWTLESVQYFCGKYPVAKLYGVETQFELIENRLDGFCLQAVLRKPADSSS